LNAVSTHFLKDKKIDMPVKEMFLRFREGDPHKLGEVAEYCLKDTDLPHRIAHKTCLIQNLIEMAKATWVPLSYLSERGQQIKVFSQVCRKARELGFMVPTLKVDKAAESEYQGATVLDAQTGAYYTPITALDFASLYPSIMRAHNLCFSTLVMDPKYKNLPGIEYETFGPHTFAQGVPSLLPVILNELAAFRKKAKKDMAKAEGTPMEAVYNGKQLAYKISMNSVYGFTGASKGMLPLLAIASTVTFRGRQMIEETKNYVEKNFPGAKVRYGDSVSGSTPILVRRGGRVYNTMIQNLVHYGFSEYPGFMKEGTDKEQCKIDGVETWTHLGWQKIKRVIRHKTTKNLYRVTTASGMVEVTEDHSLLGPNLELIKPQEAVTGTRLFHLECTDESEVQYIKPGDLDYWDKKDWFESRENLDSLAPACKKTKCARMDMAQYAYMKIRQMGLDVTLTDQGDHLIEISWCEHSRSPRDKVKSVRHLPRADPVTVFDLETEAGTFQAGVGCMIVKNTDSVMVEFDVQGRTGQDAIDYSWELGEQASEQCSKLFKAPNDLELEKVYCPYFLYSKKRYAAKMYEKKGDTVVFKKIDVKGLQVVRRDTCPYVRNTLKQLLTLILDSNDPRPAIEFARQAGRDLLMGRVDVDHLTMSKQLSANYKTKQPHVEVRNKIRERAPGSEPQNGDRVPFLITKGTGILCDKAEDPSYVKEHKVPLDFAYYFEHQLQKPVCDLLEPLVGHHAFETIFKSIDYLTTRSIASYFTPAR
jgi:DNA polymerase family B